MGRILQFETHIYLGAGVLHVQLLAIGLIVVKDHRARLVDDLVALDSAWM